MSEKQHFGIAFWIAAGLAFFICGMLAIYIGYLIGGFVGIGVGFILYNGVLAFFGAKLGILVDPRAND